MANLAGSVMIILLSLILFSATAAQQVDNNSNTFRPQQVACAGVKRALYTTDVEMFQDPCDFSCSFNPFTGSLQAECRYDYCEVRVRHEEEWTTLGPMPTSYLFSHYHIRTSNTQHTRPALPVTTPVPFALFKSTPSSRRKPWISMRQERPIWIWAHASFVSTTPKARIRACAVLS